MASRALSAAPKGTGLREQLDMHLTQAQLELKLESRAERRRTRCGSPSTSAERLEDGAWRAPVAMTLGHLSMRLADPRTAAKHYAAALARAPARGTAAMSAHGNLAIALGSIGRFDEGRYHATQAIGIARELAAGWRHADAHDVLAIVEIAADRPLAALHAIDEALVVLGEIDHPMLRYQLAEHRTWALAMLGRAPAARQWLAKAEKLRAELWRRRRHRRAGPRRHARAHARVLRRASARRSSTPLTHAEKLPDAFVTGSLNLVVGRCALALGDEAAARAWRWSAPRCRGRSTAGCSRTAQASHGAVAAGAASSGDSRVVRYAERMMALVERHDGRRGARRRRRLRQLAPRIAEPPVVGERPGRRPPSRSKARRSST